MNAQEKKRRREVSGLHVIQPDVAGIDLGSREHYVCCPSGEDGKPNVCRFGTTTPELCRLADWLQKQRVSSAAMESTGVYWIPLYELLEKRGFDVVLVNARMLLSVPGRKTDMLDCQWIQRLHSCGLLKGSFRPKEAICRWRAIVEGQRDVAKLAELRDPCCHKNIQQISEHLTGNWRDEHLFVLSRYAMERREGYRVFVESGLAEDDEDLKEVMSRSSKAIGDRRFCLEVERYYREAVKTKQGGSDVTMRRIEVGADPDVLLDRICETFGVKKEELSRRRSVSDARLVAARLLKDQTSLSGREIGRRLGLADGSGLSNYLAIAERCMSSDRKLRRILEKLSSDK